MENGQKHQIMIYFPNYLNPILSFSEIYRFFFVSPFIRLKYYTRFLVPIKLSKETLVKQHLFFASLFILIVFSEKLFLSEIKDHFLKFHKIK